MKYDAIVIGSGLGGLSAAASLAKRGVGIKLLEKHTQPGGYATTFFRDRFEFEVSLHALSGIGTPDNPGPLLNQLEAMDVARRVEFIPLDDLYRTIGPNVDMVAPKGAERFVEALSARFPTEAKGIRRLIDQVLTIGDEVEMLRAGGYSRAPLPMVARFPNLAHAAGVPLSKVLDRELSSPLAKLALAQLWGYFGLPPSKLSMLMFAAGMNAYLRYGATGIRGNSQSLADAFVDVIRESGGEVTLANGVAKILTGSGRVTGVVTEGGERFEADTVIANANPITTLNELVEPGQVLAGSAAHLSSLPISLGTVSVYLGLSKRSAELGIEDYEVYLNRQVDMEEQYQTCFERTDPGSLAVCAYDLINPDAAPPGAGVVVVSALAQGKAWEQLEPTAYHEAKERMAKWMIQRVEQQYPGLSRYVETISVSTPITNMRYTGNPGGAIYGFANTPELNPGFRPENKGPLEGLWFAGAWTQPGGGFQATITSGVNTATAVLQEKHHTGKGSRPASGAGQRITAKLPGSVSRRLRGFAGLLRDGKTVKETIASKYKKKTTTPPLPAPSVEQVVRRFHATRLPVVLTERIRQTPDTVTLRFNTVQGALPPFKSGQYFNVYVEQDGVLQSRPYSVSSPAGQRGYLEITVKEKLDGYVSGYLADQLRIGECVQVTGPNGDFYYQPLRDTTELVGVAVGSGITPFMSMIEEFEQSGSPVHLTLFYGSRRPSETIFHDRLNRLARSRDWLTLYPVYSKPPGTWRGDVGRITIELILRHLGDQLLAEKTFLLCGPRELYQELLAELVDAGVPQGRLRVEAYGPPARVSREVGWPNGIDETAEFLVRFNNHERPIRAPAGVPLLNSLEQAGVHRSALCRSGVCDACKVQLVSGDVFVPPSNGMLPTGNRAGRIQPCMCYPISDLSIVA